MKRGPKPCAEYAPIVEMLRQGKTPYQIRQVFPHAPHVRIRRYANSIGLRLFTAGETLRGRQTERTKQFLADIKSGMRVPDIAKKYGVSRAHVYLTKNPKPEKLAARKILATAIRKGSVIRPSICQKCSVTGKIQAHHTDYSRPFDVMWLCRKCHDKEHRP